jgi:hypothetical protein
MTTIGSSNFVERCCGSSRDRKMNLLHFVTSSNGHSTT